MPFALIFIGLVIFVSAYRNTQGQLAAALKNDFTGSGNFFYWLVAILLIGSLGYIGPIRPIARAFLVLLLIVMVLANGGFWAKLVSSISAVQNNGPASANAVGTDVPVATSTAPAATTAAPAATTAAPSTGAPTYANPSDAWSSIYNQSMAG